MRRMRQRSAVASRRRRIGWALFAVALALLVAVVINVWLAVTMAEWWPLVVATPELVGMVASAVCAYRYLWTAREVADTPDEPSEALPILP